jgi:hypothetical protein
MTACLAALCCCCVAEEGCEACADCAGMFPCCYDHKQKLKYVPRLRRGMLLDDRSNLYVILVYRGKRMGSNWGQIGDIGLEGTYYVG